MKIYLERELNDERLIHAKDIFEIKYCFNLYNIKCLKNDHVIGILIEKESITDSCDIHIHIFPYYQYYNNTNIETVIEEAASEFVKSTYKNTINLICTNLHYIHAAKHIGFVKNLDSIYHNLYFYDKQHGRVSKC